MDNVKMYREILDFVQNQKDVINSFRKEKQGLAENKSINMLLDTLEENLLILKRHINNIVDGDGKNGNI